MLSSKVSLPYSKYGVAVYYVSLHLKPSNLQRIRYNTTQRMQTLIESIANSQQGFSEEVKPYHAGYFQAFLSNLLWCLQENEQVMASSFKISKKVFGLWLDFGLTSPKRCLWLGTPPTLLVPCMTTFYYPRQRQGLRDFDSWILKVYSRSTIDWSKYSEETIYPSCCCFEQYDYKQQPWFFGWQLLNFKQSLDLKSWSCTS